MSSVATHSKPAPLLPLFADLRGRAVLVVGDTASVARKVEELLEAEAVVALAAPAPTAALARLLDSGRVRRLAGAFAPAWLDGVSLVIAASHAAAVNHTIAAAARARGIFVNVVDDAQASSVHMPARVRRDPLQVAVSSGGAVPVLARRVRERLEAELDQSWTELAERFAVERASIRARFPHAAERRRLYERAIDAAATGWQRVLGPADGATGSVTLVGAGPGDPGLLTLRALRALQDADVIIHDRLVSSDVLDLARRDAERIDAGKRVGENPAAAQERVHALLLQHARAGRRVVRLQGGDPLVFGRAAEELEFLRAHAIPHSVIPGITAAAAAAASARIALTDRRCAHGVTLLSARAIAPTHDNETLAIYMGVGELDSLPRALIARGRRADTPCVLVENASRPHERRIAGRLSELAELARAQHVRPPALLIVGEVAAPARRAGLAERCCSAPVAVAAVA